MASPEKRANTDIFLDKYHKLIDPLNSSDKDRLRWHCFLGLITQASLFAQMNSSYKNEIVTLQSQAFGASTPQRFRAYRQILEFAAQVPTKNKTLALRQEVNMHQARLVLYETMRRSVRVLISPTEANRRKLLSQSQDLATVAQAFTGIHDSSLTARLNGVETMIALNLALNAYSHGNRSIQVYQPSPDSYVVQNNSNEPFDPKKRSNRFGLKIIDLYTTLLENAEVSYTSDRPDPNGPFIVSALYFRNIAHQETVA